MLPQRFRLGVGSLMLHKLRSALAVLGILIGVTAVIWLVAMGEGVSYQAQQQIKDLGATSIIVRSIKPPQEKTRNQDAILLTYGLLRDDYDRLLADVPTIRRAVPMREISREVHNRDRVVDAKLIGCTPEYLAINHLQMERGRALSDYDLKRVDNVAVLASGAANVLFPIEDPLGQAVLIDKDFYVVIGVAAERTAAAAIGGSLEARQYDSDVYIPITTFRRRIGDTVVTEKAGQQTEGRAVRPASSQRIKPLNQFRHAPIQ